MAEIRVCPIPRIGFPLFQSGFSILFFLCCCFVFDVKMSTSEQLPTTDLCLCFFFSLCLCCFWGLFVSCVRYLNNVGVPYDPVSIKRDYQDHKKYQPRRSLLWQPHKPRSFLLVCIDNLRCSDISQVSSFLQP